MTELTPRKIERALLSVSDKTGLVEFGRFLAGQGVAILSTGGSARTLREAGIAVTDVSEHTEFPEMMGGRVKTLHPVIHGGILGRRDNEEDRSAFEAYGIGPIDLVVVNLYPFQRVVREGGDFDTCIENIDIGGPALIRSAAKNHAFVTVVVDPEDYAAVTAEMEATGGAVGGGLRRRLAAQAYARTALYDSIIASWFAGQEGEHLPKRLVLGGGPAALLRYGENPHQVAAFYPSADRRPGAATATQIQGKALSYNNINDTDAAFELVAEFDRPAVAIIKHANPCGVAVADTLAAAYAQALACDPVSAYGGIIAVNRALDAETAAAIAELFVEVIIAPEVDDGAKALLAAKKNLRLLVTGTMPDAEADGIVARTVAGGLLVQSRDNRKVRAGDLEVVTKRKPSDREIADLLFAFSVCKHVKSNAIVYAKDGATVGIGAGQMSRVDSSRLAVEKARQTAAQAGREEVATEGSVVASDAFFPFADGLIAAAEAGVTAVIQPGGSLRDGEVVAAADARDLAMVLTGVRHFRH